MCLVDGPTALAKSARVALVRDCVFRKAVERRQKTRGYVRSSTELPVRLPFLLRQRRRYANPYTRELS